MDHSVSTPVLFITFARPEYARKAFNQIKKSKPKNLYFYSNAARKDNPDEMRKNAEIRSYIDEIEWDCNLRTFFRNKYVDMVESHEGAYGWVFKNEDRLIEIDEDCVASVAFFDYCEKLLEKYQSEKRVWMISGDNFTPEFYHGENSYFYSRYGHTYGWATWKDRWLNFERQIDDWNEAKSLPLFLNYYTHKKEAKFHLHRFSSYFKYSYPNHPIWDYLLFYKIIKSNGVCIVPKFNLVRNIGAVGYHNNGALYYFHFLNILESNSYPFMEDNSAVETDDFYDYKHFINHWVKIEKLPIYKRMIKLYRRLIKKIRKTVYIISNS